METHDPRNHAMKDSAKLSGHTTLLGCARISTDQQNLEPQLEALRQAACERVFQDIGSGSLKHRPQLDALLDHARPGDTVVVWRLDRLGRGLKHLIATVEDLHEHAIAFRSLTEQIDTTTPRAGCSFRSSAHWPSLSARSPASEPGSVSLSPGHAAASAAARERSPPRNSPRPTPCASASTL